MCTVFRVGLKCCKDGWIFKNTHCGGIGCEHDTLSISDMAWDYWERKEREMMRYYRY